MNVRLLLRRALRWQVMTTAPLTPEAPTTRGAPALSMRNLLKRFGQNTAVNDLSLDIPTGSFYGIVGPNGAGKTTSLSMATGLLRPDAGTAASHGGDVWGEPAPAKALLGVLPAGVGLVDLLTARRFVTSCGLVR